MPEVIKSKKVGVGHVWMTASKSRPGQYHTTIHSTEDGEWFCSCEGYRYKGHCWHVDELMEKTDEVEDEIQVSL